MSISSRLTKVAVVLGVSIAAGTSFGAPANSATPNTSVVSGVTNVTVTGTTLSPVPGKDYYLGICETAGYMFGIPACTWYTVVDTSSAPNFTEVFTPTK